GVLRRPGPHLRADAERPSGGRGRGGAPVSRHPAADRLPDAVGGELPLLREARDGATARARRGARPTAGPLTDRVRARVRRALRRPARTLRGQTLISREIPGSSGSLPKCPVVKV